MPLKKQVYLLLTAVFVFLFPALSYSFTKLPVNAKNISITAIQDTIPDIDTSGERIFEKVEIEAVYPGGDENWRKFLEQNLNGNVPTDNGAPSGTYTVIIQFVVDKNGLVSNIKALTNHGYGMETEVIRLLKKSPTWKPAVQDGRFVKAYRKQPVIFMVIDEKKKKKKN